MSFTKKGGETMAWTFSNDKNGKNPLLALKGYTANHGTCIAGGNVKEEL